MISAEKKNKIITDLQKDKKDSGSSAVQAGILTERIKEITEHLKKNKHDHMAKRGLIQMVGQRKKHLKFIAKKDSKQYLELIQKLGIRK